MGTIFTKYLRVSAHVRVPKSRLSKQRWEININLEQEKPASSVMAKIW